VTGRARRALLLAACGLLAVLPACGSGPVNGPDTGPWETVWRDDFEGAAGAPADPSSWTPMIGNGYPGGPYGWGNDELQYYTGDPANVALDGAGHLRITAVRTDGGTWTSARLETVRDDFAPPPGGALKIEARLRLPDGGRGYWPAFWALGAPLRSGADTWPGTGEIDVMENVNGAPEVHGSLHCASDLPGGCGPGRPLTGTTALGPGPRDAHTFAVVWDDGAGRLDWFLDGRHYWSVTRDTTGAAAWERATGHGYFLLLNLAVGGDWPGYPDDTTRPGRSMLVDHVLVAAREP
jgi:beta-glucanase (GH16 family)